MRGFLIFPLIIISVQLCLNSCKYSDSSGKKVNKTLNGYIKSVGDSVKNKREGEWIICSGIFKDKIDTIEIRYYKNGKLNGLCKSLGTENNWIYINWKNGVKHGSEFEILSNGDSLFRGKWINNLPIGKHTKYYYKGQVFKEFRPSKNEGDLTNLRQEYMEHRISSQYSYNNRGELDGDCCEFDINGMLTIYGRFKCDKKNGIWLEKNFLDNYYDIYNLGKYKNDKKDGLWISYKQQFNYQIFEYEPNDDFFESFRKKINKKYIISEITYSNGVKIKERYFIDGKIFNSQNEMFDYTVSSINSKNNEQKIQDVKKSTYSY